MSLKVFDLQCASGHVFEGWFSSHDDYDSQLARGLLVCPLCNDHHVIKRLSAPRLNVAHIRASASDVPRPPTTRRSNDDGPVADTRSGHSSHAGDGAMSSAARGGVQTTEAAQVAKLQAALMRQVRQVINAAENVGPRFAEEARRIHDEGTHRAIRGTATASERAALADDGIEVVTLPDIFDDDRLQ